jgi:hypothetical protein
MPTPVSGPLLLPVRASWPAAGAGAEVPLDAVAAATAVLAVVVVLAGADEAVVAGAAVVVDRAVVVVFTPVVVVVVTTVVVVVWHGRTLPAAIVVHGATPPALTGAAWPKPKSKATPRAMMSRGPNVRLSMVGIPLGFGASTRARPFRRAYLTRSGYV